MVELFGGVLGLNLLCLAEVIWGLQKRREDNSKKKSSHGILNLLVRDQRGHSGATMYTQSECALGRKGGKDWHFIRGGRSWTTYIHTGRRRVNVYQRIRKEFPLSLSAPTICLLQSLQGRCSIVHGSNNNKRSSLSSQCDLFGCPYFLFGSK